MKIFVAASNQEGVSNSYKTLASSLATFLANRGHKLVFNGCDTGMIGKVFYTFKYENGLVKGITDLSGADILNELECNAKDITPSTFDKTKKLFTSSDMAIILPGGMDVLSEFFSILEEKRAKSLNYPVILFTYDNFYTPMLEFLIKSHNINFNSESDLKLFDIVTNLDNLENYIIDLERKEEDR